MIRGPQSDSVFCNLPKNIYALFLFTASATSGWAAVQVKPSKVFGVMVIKQVQRASRQRGWFSTLRDDIL